MAAVSKARLRGKESSSNHRPERRRELKPRMALGILIVVDAVAFLVASAVHFGARIPLGVTTLSDVTLLPAGIAEGAIGVAFVLAAVGVFMRRAWAWSGALGAFLFGVLGVLLGLSITLSDSGDSSPANLLFHEAILPVLVLGLTLLLTRSAKAALGRSTVPREVRP